MTGEFLPGLEPVSALECPVAKPTVERVALPSPFRSAALLTGGLSKPKRQPIPRADFRFEQSARGLCRDECEAVQRRRRFWSLPWLRPARQTDPADRLP